MTHIPNPYIVGTPIPNQAYFYGREELISFVRDTINPPQQRVVVLYGQRRVGKTSVLYALARQLSENYSPVYFDLMGQANRPLTSALYDIASQIADDHLLDEPHPFTAPADFRRYLEQVCTELPDDKPLLLLFDEFDDLSGEQLNSDAAVHTLFDYLRDLLNVTLPIAFIFVVGRRLTELPENFKSILKQAPSRRVSFLSKSGTAILITKPAAGTINYTPQAVEAIYNLTSGHPYFTQLICFELFRLARVSAKTEVTAADVTAVLEQAMETGKGGLAWFWDGLPLAERFVMSAIAEISDDQQEEASTADVQALLSAYNLKFLGLEITDAPTILVNWEILRQTDHGYRFSVDLVRRWIRAEHPLTNARREIESIVPRANRNFANARDAHQAGELNLAIEDYRRTLAANPNHLRAHLGLAQAHEEQGNWESANEAYRQAYELDKNSACEGLVHSYEQLSASEMAQGHTNTAINALQMAQKYAYSADREEDIQSLIIRRDEFSRKQFWKYAAVGALVTTVVLILYTMFASNGWLSTPAATNNTANSMTSLDMVSQASEGERLILINSFTAEDSLTVLPEASLEAVWASTFPNIRFERVSTTITEPWQAFETAEALGAVGVLWGSVSNQEVSANLTLLDYPNEQITTLPIDQTATYTDLKTEVNSELIQNFAEHVAEEFDAIGGGASLEKLLAGNSSDVSGVELGRLALYYVHSATDVLNAETFITPGLSNGYFPSFVNHYGAPQLPIAFIPQAPYSTFATGGDLSTLIALCTEYASENECKVNSFGNITDETVVDIPPFYIDATEVSNASYRACVEDGVCPLPSEDASTTRPHYYSDTTYDTYPVQSVSWVAANTFCSWVDGYLPSAAQWEKAARWSPTAGTTNYPWGSTIPDYTIHGNFGGNIGDTTAVAQYPAGVSPLGLHDTAGNVWEWTATTVEEDSYIAKGGSFGGYAEGDNFYGPIINIEPARSIDLWKDGGLAVGFRCAYDIPPKIQE